ncbi:MAG: DUF2911 domain-containing protein [Chitinophagaceae bacterium]|nr:DUF2911 domain-containing protein [Chitinophagaceae bacterium]
MISHIMNRIRLLTLLLFSGTLAGQAQQQYHYIFKIGEDSIALQHYTREKTIVEGEIISRFPRVMLTTFRYTLNPNGFIQKFEYRSSYPGVSDAIMERQVAIEDTIVSQEMKRSGKRDSIFSGTFIVQRGAVPSMDNDVSLFEQMLRQALKEGKDSIMIQRFTNQPSKSYIKKVKDGEFETKVFFFPVRIRVNNNGHLSEVDATATTIKTIATAIAPFNFIELAGIWTEKEKKEGRAGLLSPSDTVRAVIKGNEMQITFGRPQKRGREIFGNVVPWNQLWRLGSNFATHLTLSKEIQCGDKTIPAGRYTIWMVPGQEKAILIINKAINIFGTQYDRSKDLLQLPMKTSRLSAPVEKLSFLLRENETGGELVVQWDDYSFSLDFR